MAAKLIRTLLAGRAAGDVIVLQDVRLGTDNRETTP